MTLAQDRVARGQCPHCGKEAAPYYLCFDCRFRARVTRILNRGARVGGLTKERRDGDIFYNLPKDGRKETGRWGTTPIVFPETDKRGHPKLRGVRVDVERTLVEVVRHIGRPCTIGEIMIGWGKLRAKRDAPLANDLARIIAAEDRRSAKNAKRLAASGMLAADARGLGISGASVDRASTKD